MKYEEYLELSEKTLSSELHIDDSHQNLLHAVMGIATEVEELLENYTTEDSMDSVNILEEIGDVTWYLAIIHREFPHFKSHQTTNITVKHDTPLDCVLDINKSTLKLLDFMKKKLFYNKPIKQDIFENITLLIDGDIIWLTNFYDINIENVWDVNIKKLKARFGDKFSSDKAINRNLETERGILENGED